MMNTDSPCGIEGAEGVHGPPPDTYTSYCCKGRFQRYSRVQKPGAGGEPTMSIKLAGNAEADLWLRMTNWFNGNATGAFTGAAPLYV